jgi:hypothetical protein
VLKIKRVSSTNAPWLLYIGGRMIICTQALVRYNILKYVLRLLYEAHFYMGWVDPPTQRSLT